MAWEHISIDSPAAVYKEKSVNIICKGARGTKAYFSADAAVYILQKDFKFCSMLVDKTENKVGFKLHCEQEGDAISLGRSVNTKSANATTRVFMSITKQWRVITAEMHLKEFESYKFSLKEEGDDFWYIECSDLVEK